MIEILQETIVVAFGLCYIHFDVNGGEQAILERAAFMSDLLD
jgi:hypothetical protein